MNKDIFHPWCCKRDTTNPAANRGPIPLSPWLPLPNIIIPGNALIPSISLNKRKQTINKTKSNCLNETILKITAIFPTSLKFDTIYEN